MNEQWLRIHDIIKADGFKIPRREAVIRIRERRLQVADTGLLEFAKAWDGRDMDLLERTIRKVVGARIPDGAELIAFWWRVETRSIYAMFSHPTFDVVTDGFRPPEIDMEP